MFVEKIIPVVREAASLMLRSGFEVMEKGSSANLVTSSDLAVQHYLVRHLGVEQATFTARGAPLCCWAEGWMRAI